MDYQSRKIAYQNLLNEIEIGGEEHLKVILEDSDVYLKKANELRERVSSDSFLTGGDKEQILKKVGEYVEKVTKNRNNNFWNYALAFLSGVAVGYIIPHDVDNQKEFVQDALRGFYSEIERIKKSV